MKKEGIYEFPDQSYRYGTNPANNDFRKLNWQMTENGSVYEFSYDAAGRMTERRHPWLDGADGRLIIEKYAYFPTAPVRLSCRAMVALAPPPSRSARSAAPML